MIVAARTLNEIIKNITVLGKKFEGNFPLYTVRRMRLVFSFALFIQAIRLLYYGDDFKGFDGGFIYIIVMIILPGLLEASTRIRSWKPKLEAAVYFSFCLFVDGMVSKSMHIHHYTSVALCISAALLCIYLIMSDKNRH